MYGIINDETTKMLNCKYLCQETGKHICMCVCVNSRFCEQYYKCFIFVY